MSPGWTVGGGVEWMVMPRWSMKAEYLYADLGTLADQHVFPGAPLAVSTHNHRFHRKSVAARAQPPLALVFVARMEP